MQNKTKTKTKTRSRGNDPRPYVPKAQYTPETVGGVAVRVVEVHSAPGNSGVTPTARITLPKPPWVDN